MSHVAGRVVRSMGPGTGEQLDVDGNAVPSGASGAWPAPKAAKITLDLAQSRLVVPERTGWEGALGDLGTSRAAPPPETRITINNGFDRQVDRTGEGGARVTITDDLGTFRLCENALTITVKGVETYR